VRPTLSLSRTRGRRGGFIPQQLSAVSGLLSLAASPQSGGEWTSWVDIISGNNGAINAARRPAVAAAANGLPLAAFLTNDAVAWPIAASNFNRDTWGIFLDAKPTAVASTQILWCISNGNTNGADHKAIVTFFSLTDWIIDVYATDANGRRFIVPLGAAAGVSRRYGIEYDSGAGGDANVYPTINGVVQSTVKSNLGAGATLGQLQVCTGNLLIGNFNDGAASSALTGSTGPNVVSLTSKLAGASSGQLLTAEGRARLVGYQVPA
jgi:hypothetical protein